MKKTSLLLALLVAASLRAQDGIAFENAPVEAVLQAYAEISGKTLVIAENLTRVSITHKAVSQGLPLDEMLAEMENALFKAGIEIVRLDHERVNVGPVQKRQAQRPPLRGDFPMPWRLDPDSPDEWPMPTDNLAAFELMLALNPANTRYRERLEKRRLELLVQRAARTPAEAGAIDEAAEKRAAEMFVRMMRRRNLDSLRAGESGLGIPPSPEEEAMLAAEGVVFEKPKPVDARDAMPVFEHNTRADTHWLKIIDEKAAQNNVVIPARRVNLETLENGVYKIPVECDWKGAEKDIVEFLHQLQRAGITFETGTLRVKPDDKTPGQLTGRFTFVCSHMRAPPSAENAAP